MELKPKRVGPPKVAPVTIGPLRFEAVHWGKKRGLGQNGGYVAAFDAKSGQEVWLVQVYAIQYDDHLESDVQDVFIETMTKSRKGQKLEIADERGRRWVVDPETRRVQSA